MMIKRRWCITLSKKSLTLKNEQENFPAQHGERERNFSLLKVRSEAHRMSEKKITHMMDRFMSFSIAKKIKERK
jgi:hypothetical protein